MTETITVHANPLTPQGSAAWHWEIAVYLFLGGMTAGLMIISGLLDRRLALEARSRWSRWMPFVAAVLISLGMLALWLDLESRLRAYRFYLAFRWSAPMSWGAWILVAIYPATLLFGLGQLTDGEAARLSRFKPLAIARLGGLVTRGRNLALAHRSGLRITNIVLGILLGGYTGVLLSTLGARAAWSTTILGPLFLVSGLSTGAALMMLFPMGKEEHTIVRSWDVLAIVVELALIAIFVVGLSTGGEAERAVGALLTGGKMTALFWSLVVATGLVVPLLIETLEARRRLAPRPFAPMLLLIGGLSLRWILVSIGQLPLS